MLECLDGYVGLWYCDTAYGQAASGLYVNQLPGVSIESIDMTANDEQITYLGLWDDVQKAAKPRFRLDFITKLTECFKLSRGCDYDSIICQEKNLELLSVAWQYLLANQLMLFRLHTNRLNRYTTIDKEDAEKLRDYFSEEYYKYLAIAVKLVDVGDCACIQCGGNPEYVTWLP